MLRWMQVALVQPNRTYAAPERPTYNIRQEIEWQEIVEAISLVATRGVDRPVQPVIILGIDITKTS